MFNKLTKGDLVLRPDLVHGGRRDKCPTIFYVKDRVQAVDVSKGLIVVNGRSYDNTSGKPSDGLHHLRLKPFIFPDDETVKRDEFLTSLQIRKDVRAMLQDDEVLERLNHHQLMRILNILDVKSRRYREQ